jgi:hypothetical protein
MSTFKQCTFYRDSGVTYCDLDGNQKTCNGDLNFCEDVKFSDKSDALTKYLQVTIDEFEKIEIKED